jgi:hypothetical protein
MPEVPFGHPCSREFSASKAAINSSRVHGLKPVHHSAKLWPPYYPIQVHENVNSSPRPYGLSLSPGESGIVLEFLQCTNQGALGLNP